MKGYLLNLYYRARYYNASIQRVISLDPIGFLSGDFKFYQYTSNDPSGLDPRLNAKVGVNIGADVELTGADLLNSLKNNTSSILSPKKEIRKYAIEQMELVK